MAEARVARRQVCVTSTLMPRRRRAWGARSAPAYEEQIRLSRFKIKQVKFSKTREKAWNYIKNLTLSIISGISNYGNNICQQKALTTNGELGSRKPTDAWRAQRATHRRFPQRLVSGEYTNWAKRNCIGDNYRASRRERGKNVPDGRCQISITAKYILMRSFALD